jgi:hypothetical protein
MEAVNFWQSMKKASESTPNPGVHLSTHLSDDKHIKDIAQQLPSIKQKYSHPY